MTKSMISALIAVCLSSVCYADVVVVTHSSNTAAISPENVKKIFMGKTKKFPGGGSATPINLPEDSSARAEFTKKYIGKSISQLNAYWARLEFSGKALPPEEKTVDEIIAYIKSDPTSIGYIDRSNVDPGLRVLE